MSIYSAVQRNTPKSWVISKMKEIIFVKKKFSKKNSLAKFHSYFFNHARVSIPDEVSVAAHLQSMRPAPTTMKDTIMLRKNSNTNTIKQTFNYALFLRIVHIYGFVSNTCP